MKGDEEVAELLGQDVLIRSRNIVIGGWERGVLEELEFKATDESFAYIRMKSLRLHKISLRDFIVQKR